MMQTHEQVELPGRKFGSTSRLAVLRPVIDAFAAFLLFLAVSLTLQSAPSAAQGFHLGQNVATFQPQTTPAIADSDEASIIEIATAAPDSPNAVYRRTSSAAAWLLLAAAFSLVVALNLAFIRHMRHAYAKPRRRRG